MSSLLNYSTSGFLALSLASRPASFIQIPPTRVCFTNAGVNSNGAIIHKKRKKACNLRLSIVPILNFTFQSWCKNNISLK